jgi:hypothetical protein
MSCCADGGECPMHKDHSDESGAERVLTQAQADACCAASEDKQSNSSNPGAVAAISAAVLGVRVVLPVIAPALVLTDDWRTDAPAPGPPVSRHLLLSVFLL